MSYLNCPFCPAQAFPVNAWAGTIKSATGTYPAELYKCISGHRFYVEGEREISDYAEIDGC